MQKMNMTTHVYGDSNGKKLIRYARKRLIKQRRAK